MGLEWKITTPGAAKLGLWRIEERAEALEVQIPEAIRSKDPVLASGTDAKRTQRAAVRALVQELLPHGLPITYEDRVPKLNDSAARISITHDAEFVAVHITRLQQPAGIDLQKSRSAQLERVAPRFLNESELECIGKALPQERKQMLNLFWCTKEALYKGISNAPFRERMQVETLTPSSSGRIRARVQLPDAERKVELVYQALEEHHLVYIADEGFL